MAKVFLPLTQLLCTNTGILFVIRRSRTTFDLHWTFSLIYYWKRHCGIENHKQKFCWYVLRGRFWQMRQNYSYVRIDSIDSYRLAEWHWNDSNWRLQNWHDIFIGMKFTVQCLSAQENVIVGIGKKLHKHQMKMFSSIGKTIAMALALKQYERNTNDTKATFRSNNKQ